jgi:L-asparaginase
MMYSECDGRFVQTCIETGASGIVVQAANTGNVNTGLHTALVKALEAGIAVVLTTNLPAGQVFPIYGYPGGGKALMDAGAIMAEDLKPRKARLLLMFALGETRDPKRLQEIFLNA